MSGLTELSNGWYRYEESRGDIEIRKTKDGYEFGPVKAIVDHISYDESGGGASVGGLMANAVMELEEGGSA